MSILTPSKRLRLEHVIPSHIQRSFMQATLATVVALGISLPARADDFPAPSATVPQLEDTSHRSKDTNCEGVWHFFLETDRKGSHASGLSGYCPGATTYVGLSVQQIRSPKITYDGHQDNLESVYLFIGRQMDWPITPFVETGLDFGEALLEDLLKDSENDESSQTDSSIVDYYFALGIQTRLRQSLFMRAYYKIYMIQQEDRLTLVPVAGILLGVRF